MHTGENCQEKRCNEEIVRGACTATPSSTLSYPIVDPYGDHVLGCPRSLPYRTIFWHDPLRDAYAPIGRIAGLRTRAEVSGMIPGNSKRPGVVYTTDDGAEQKSSLTSSPAAQSSCRPPPITAPKVSPPSAQPQRFRYQLQTPSMGSLSLFNFAVVCPHTTSKTFEFFGCGFGLSEGGPLPLPSGVGGVSSKASASVLSPAFFKAAQVVLVLVLDLSDLFVICLSTL